MKIIISPAKKMNVKDDILECEGLPVYWKETQALMEYMKSLTYEEAKSIWNCNDKIAALNYERFSRMDLAKRLTPAILSYEGIQYQYMAPEVFNRKQLEYVQKHLRILSGFYGVLAPFDGIVPYRLEMQARITWQREDALVTNLYQYWGDQLYRQVTKDDPVILNLASKEYSKAMEAWLEPNGHMITCVFGCLVPDQSGTKKVKVKASEAKMARGEMVRYLAEQQIQEPQKVQTFDRLGYRFCHARSDERTFVFLK